MIIMPIQTIVMTFRLCTFKKINKIRYKLNLLKIAVFFTGIYLKSLIDSSYPLFYLQHKLRGLRGIKIFALLKIIEFITHLLNRCNKDYELQLLTIISEKKIKRKIITICIILLTLSLNIFSFIGYMTSISITLNDSSNAIYPLFFKVNYIELKKCGKPIKKKNIVGQINTDIYDRFFNNFVLVCVIFQNYYENKINSHNFIDYFYRAIFSFIFEIFFDWVKDYIIFRISYFNPKILKLISFEIALYHDKMRYKCINSNGAVQSSKKERNNYLKFLENKELLIIGKQYRYEKYLPWLEFENVMCLTMHINILIYCLIMTSVFLPKVLTSKFNLLLCVISLILLRKILQIALSNFIIGFNRKRGGKSKDSLIEEAQFYVNDPTRLEITTVNNFNGNFEQEIIKEKEL